MSINYLKTIALTLIILLSASAIAPAAAKRRLPQSTQSYQPVSKTDAHPLVASATGDYIIEGSDQGATCRDASLEESQALTARDQLVPLHVISPVRQDGINPPAAGLTIILRSTQQLENFPQAKSAFLRAAETWESLIRSPITVIIDVDYGPTRFGVPYPNPNILGSTNSQVIGNTSAYPTVRNSLLAQASSPRESALYNALPFGTLPTDLGSTAALRAPSAVFRALGIIGAVADPASETASLGPVPSIGFNSSFQFDFDPSNGIDANKTDFDAVAVHEIGHALGFVSNAGATELNPGAVVAPSTLDLLRFRPGVSLATFPNALRVQSSGGAQVFFAGDAELALSTGRPDASGGDGRQASHWKDDALTGQYLGIMDPVINQGTRYAITDNDLLAFDAMGYQVGPSEETIALTPGVAQPGSLDSPEPGRAVLSATQYTIQVPAGATQLTIDLNGNQDIDLFVQFGQRITIGAEGPVADYKSDSSTGNESITVTSASSPPLRAGTYFIAVANYGPGPASFNVKATVTGGGNRAPAINSLQANLDGDNLTLTGVAADPDGDIVQAQSNLLDAAGQIVGQTQPFDVSFGTATSVNFTLTITNLNSIPAALQASLILIDRSGNRSPAVTADFSPGDAGGPTIANVSYNGKKLTIKGGGFANQVLIEINGRVVTLTQSASQKKIQVKGNANQLNLRAGPNRVCVFNGSLRSNLFVLGF